MGLSVRLEFGEFLQVATIECDNHNYRDVLDELWKTPTNQKLKL